MSFRVNLRKVAGGGMALAFWVFLALDESRLGWLDGTLSQWLFAIGDFNVTVSLYKAWTHNG